MQNQQGGFLTASSIGLIVAAATALRHFHQKKPPSTDNADILKLAPTLDRSESGRLGRLERFSHYLARQIGFEDPSECPMLCKLGNDYLRRSDGCESAIFGFLVKDPEAESLYVKLIEEMERCILTYFAFHWTHSSYVISQVMEGDDDSREKTKLKDFVMAATRKQRFEKTVKNLKLTRVFSTIVEEIKLIGGFPSSNGRGESKCTEVMAPMAHDERSPVLLLMGGGMGAGKSTVLKELLKEPFWAGAKENAVIVEADAFKETDVIYRALNSKGRHSDMLHITELVHKPSTDAAASLLVTALNEGRDVILDSTLSTLPYVVATIAMARDVHNYCYRMGSKFRGDQDGIFWEKIEDDNIQQPPERKPYRIELAGVVCDPYLAVARGIRRAVIIGRAVRVNLQLRSHKRFASAFSTYSHLVDSAKLYSTNAIAGPPRLIACKNGSNNLLVDPDEFKIVKSLSNLNDDADSIYELYREDPNPLYEPGSAWNEIVMLPSRPEIQLQLKTAIMKLEA